MKREYLITVSANGMTSSYSQKADDLFDAMQIVKKLQDGGTPSIQVSVSDVEHLQRQARILGLLPKEPQ